MKVAVYQTDPTLLDLKANLEDIISKIQKAKEKKVDLIVLPELALTGYFVGERYHEVALTIESKEIKKLAFATKGTAAIVGFIEESKSMNFYNSAIVVVDGQVLFAYRKLNLPNYGVFEERKYFSNGKRVSSFRLHGYNLSVFICNDMWHPALPYLGVCQKADIFITISNSSEGSLGSEFSNIESWEIINRFYSRVFGIYNISSNRVGTECFGEKRCGSTENMVEENAHQFWGGSEIINPFGKQIAKAKLYKPDTIYAEISRDLLRRKKILLPYLRDDEPHFTYRELKRILYDKTQR